MTRPKTPIRTLAALLSLGLCAGAALLAGSMLARSRRSDP